MSTPGNSLRLSTKRQGSGEITPSSCCGIHDPLFPLLLPFFPFLLLKLLDEYPYELWFRLYEHIVEIPRGRFMELMVLSKGRVQTSKYLYHAKFACSANVS